MELGKISLKPHKTPYCFKTKPQSQKQSSFFHNCFLYPRAVCIMKHVALQESCLELQSAVKRSSTLTKFILFLYNSKLQCGMSVDQFPGCRQSNNPPSNHNHVIRCLSSHTSVKIRIQGTMKHFFGICLNLTQLIQEHNL